MKKNKLLAFQYSLGVWECQDKEVCPRQVLGISSCPFITRWTGTSYPPAFYTICTNPKVQTNVSVPCIYTSSNDIHSIF